MRNNCSFLSLRFRVIVFLSEYYIVWAWQVKIATSFLKSEKKNPQSLEKNFVPQFTPTTYWGRSILSIHIDHLFMSQVQSRCLKHIHNENTSRSPSLCSFDSSSRRQNIKNIIIIIKLCILLEDGNHIFYKGIIEQGGCNLKQLSQSRCFEKVALSKELEEMMKPAAWALMDKLSRQRKRWAKALG